MILYWLTVAVSILFLLVMFLLVTGVSICWTLQWDASERFCFQYLQSFTQGTRKTQRWKERQSEYIDLVCYAVSNIPIWTIYKQSWNVDIFLGAQNGKFYSWDEINLFWEVRINFLVGLRAEMRQWHWAPTLVSQFHQLLRVVSHLIVKVEIAVRWNSGKFQYMAQLP